MLNKINTVVLVVALITITADAGLRVGVETDQTANWGYRECVGYALEKSPYLTNSYFEIRVRRLAESDSKHAFLPAVNLRTSYLLNLPDGGDEPYSLQFVSSSYNPVAAWFSLRANRLMTEAAQLSHVSNVALCLHKIAEVMLELAAVDELTAHQKQLILIANEKVKFVATRVRTDGMTSVDHRIALQEKQIELLRHERLVASRHNLMSRLKLLLGWPAEHRLDIASGYGGAGGVFDRYDSAAATIATARTNSIELALQRIWVRLAELNVTAAYAKYIPDLTFGVETADPISSANDGGLYPSVGLNMPIWDGLDRRRNIKRQKIVSEQARTTETIVSIELTGRWQLAVGALKSAEIEADVARNKHELAGLLLKKAETRSVQGSIGRSELLSARRAELNSASEAVNAGLARDKATLKLYSISGLLRIQYLKVE